MIKTGLRDTPKLAAIKLEWWPGSDWNRWPPSSESATRKVKAVTVALCGHEFSASSISQVNKSLDAALTEFARRRLTEPYPYLILDARYERIREGGVIASQAVLIAVAVDGEGRRQVLAVELANRQST